MSSVKILHNPRCSKSRQALSLIEQAGITPEVVLYLKEPVGKAFLEQLKHYLDIKSVRSIMRTKETEYRELGLGSVDDEDILLDALVTTPKLLERPIVITHSDSGIRARVGRPPENVLDILP